MSRQQFKINIAKQFFLENSKENNSNKMANNAINCNSIYINNQMLFCLIVVMHFLIFVTYYFRN